MSYFFFKHSLALTRDDDAANNGCNKISITPKISINYPANVPFHPPNQPFTKLFLPNRLKIKKYSVPLQSLK
jgi:hypothetical protein